MQACEFICVSAVQAQAVFDVNTQRAAEQRERECSKVRARDVLSSYEIRVSAVLLQLRAELAERQFGHVKQNIN